MTDPDDLDVKRLFDRAMADAPPAVELDEIHRRRREGGPARRPLTSPEPDRAMPIPRRRRWVAAASVGLVAAAIVAFMLVPNRPDDTPRTANTPEPPRTSASEVENSVATVDETDASTTTGEVAAPVPSTAAPTVAEPTLAGSFFDGVDGPPVVVLAGDAGVQVRAVDGTVTTLDVPATTAHAVSDGRVFAALGSGAMIEWDPSDDTTEMFRIPDAGARAVVLHDVAEVGGAVTLLVERPAEVCDVDADDCDVALFAFEPDTGESTRLVTLNGARSEWTTISLADTGIVVGEIAGVDGTDFYSGASGLDTAVGIPQPAALGLTTSPTGCGLCPRAYTIDGPGRHVAWRQGTDLVIVDLTDPARRAIARDVLPELEGAVDLDIAGIALDAEQVVAGVVAVTTADGTTSAVVDLADGTSSPTLPGRVTLSSP